MEAVERVGDHECILYVEGTHQDTNEGNAQHRNVDSDTMAYDLQIVNRMDGVDPVTPTLRRRSSQHHSNTPTGNQLSPVVTREAIKRVTKRVSKKSVAKVHRSPLRFSPGKISRRDGIQEDRKSLLRVVNAELSDEERLREVERQIEKTMKLPVASAYARHKLNVLRKAQMLLGTRYVFITLLCCMTMYARVHSCFAVNICMYVDAIIIIIWDIYIIMHAEFRNRVVKRETKNLQSC